MQITVKAAAVMCMQGLADHINLLQTLSTHRVEFSIIIRYLKKLSSTALQTFVLANKVSTWSGSVACTALCRSLQAG